MEVSRKTLKNGLKVVNYNMPWLDTFSMAYFFKTGSIDEPGPEYYGISHFLEHMMFNGSNKYPGKGESSIVAENYGFYENAWTYYDATSYYLSGIPKYKKLAADILNDRVKDPLLRDQDIEIEKSIISEEFRWRDDDPGSKLWENLGQLLFEKTPYEHNIIGTLDSINGFTRELLVDYRKQHYSASNIIFVTSGNISMEDTLNFVEDLFPKTRYGVNERPDLKLKKASKVKSIFEKKKELDQSLVYLGFPTSGLVTKDAYSYGLLSILLAGGKSGILRRVLGVDKDLVSNAGASWIPFKSAGMFILDMDFDNDKAGKAAKELKTQITKIKEGEVDDKDFLRAKNSAIASYEYMYEKSAPFIDFGSFVHLETVTGKEYNPDEEIDKFKEVKKEDVIKAANQIFDFDSFTMSAMGKDEKIEELLLKNLV